VLLQGLYCGSSDLFRLHLFRRTTGALCDRKFKLCVQFYKDAHRHDGQQESPSMTGRRMLAGVLCSTAAQTWGSLSDESTSCKDISGS
jgi:hypothetical protein